MDNNDKTKFLELMNGLADIYTSNLTQVGLQMRFEALKQYTIEQVTDASNIIVRTMVFKKMPTPADFIEAIEGNPDEQAEIQKSVVMGCLNAYHPRQGFKDPVTQAVINQIGWQKLGQANKKEIPFLLNDFKEMYKSYNKAASGYTLNAPDSIKGLLKTLTKGIE